MLVNLYLRVFLFIFSSTFDPEMTLNVPQVIQRWGYPVEQHEVTTDDGYILTIFRIPHGVNSAKPGCKRPPIIMDHSLLCDGSEYVINPPQSSPAMILADAGFDVFLMNHRGSTYSRAHRDFNSTDSRFWKFTIDEYAKYDNPAVIDRVLAITGEKSLYWLGHSQGALVGFALLSERLEYNQKSGNKQQLTRRINNLTIDSAIFGIAPASTAYYSRGFWRLLFVGYEIFKPLHDYYRSVFGSHEVGMGNRAIPQMLMQVLSQFCYLSMHAGLGKPANAFNTSRWPVYVSHLPASTSTWNLLHWGQMATRNKLAHFDHGPMENLKRYGRVTAPVYNLTRVEVPVHVFWSSADYLVTRRDLYENLLPLFRKEIVKGIYEVPNYNHLDFVAATDNAERVFNRVIEIVRKKEKEMCDQ